MKICTWGFNPVMSECQTQKAGRSFGFRFIQARK
jgi:hypothetical protein